MEHQDTWKGREYGKWTVLQSLAKMNGSHMVQCRCICGLTKPVMKSSLTSKASTGCMKCRDNTKHGQSYTGKYRLWMNAKMRAKTMKLPFTITLEDIVVPSHCPLLGIPIAFTHHRFCATNPSVDRIIPALGYTKGNIWVISWRANAIKHDATVEELEMLAHNLRALQSPSIATRQ